MVNDRQHYCSGSSTRSRRKRGQQEQALGRSRGGFGTKIHTLADALGDPVRFILSGGEQSDYRQALPLLRGKTAQAVLADKGYDADYIVAEIKGMNAEPVIPPKNTRKTFREYDSFLYKERNVIERTFGKMKHYRSIATRYSKTALSYLAFVQLLAIMLWLK